GYFWSVSACAFVPLRGVRLPRYQSWPRCCTFVEPSGEPGASGVGLWPGASPPIRSSKVVPPDVRLPSAPRRQSVFGSSFTIAVVHFSFTSKPLIGVPLSSRTSYPRRVSYAHAALFECVVFVGRRLFGAAAGTPAAAACSSSGGSSAGGSSSVSPTDGTGKAAGGRK